MSGSVDSFSDKWLAFLWEQTVPQYWQTCFSIPMKTSFCINSRKAKESLLGSSIYHTVILMILFLIIKDLGSSFLIFTPKNLQSLKPHNLLHVHSIWLHLKSNFVPPATFFHSQLCRSKHNSHKHFGFFIAISVILAFQN